MLNDLKHYQVKKINYLEYLEGVSFLIGVVIIVYLIVLIF